MANPNPDEVEAYVLAGERATWPKLPMIRNQTRISRTLEACNRRLRAMDRRQH
jgi:NTE family protein